MLTFLLVRVNYVVVDSFLNHQARWGSSPLHVKHGDNYNVLICIRGLILFLKMMVLYIISTTCLIEMKRNIFEAILIW